jgi:PAS domain S-box-containing protein
VLLACGVEVNDARRSKAELVEELAALRAQLATITAGEDAELPRALEALRESEARYRRLTTHASDLISEVDAEGRFLFISPNCESVLGRTAEDLTALRVADPEMLENVHPEDREKLLSAFREMVATHGEGQRRYRFRHANGSWRWFDSKFRAFTGANGQWRAVVISRDITDREEVVRRLRQSEERYRTLSVATQDLVAELDAEGRVVFASSSFHELLGYEPKQLEGTTPFNLLHPDDVERLAEMFLERLQSDRLPRRSELFRVRHRNGTWRWFEGTGTNYQTADGTYRVVSVSRDATERLRAVEERRRLEEWVQQAQKFESLGVMASGVAHDFNNLLTPILGDASLALMDLPPGSPLRSRLERIQRSAHHAAALTNQLLDYAGIGSLDVEPINVSKLMLEMSELLESAVSKRARLECELSADLPAVKADPSQLSQVVLNLITNASEAVEARPDGPRRITLRSGAVQANRETLERALLGEGLPEGRYVFFEVADTGCGMDAETRGRIFDPFFTTKFTGRGLGLAAVLGIVRKHRGAIEIESEPGQGTRIRVLCPASSAADAAARPVSESPCGWRGRGVVLVADDDEGARELEEETLKRAGFHVLSATDGAQALEVFRERCDEVRLVLLDRTMPGLSGEEVLAAIRGLRPEVPVVLVSGYSADSSAQRFAGKRVDAFLQKPFLPETLVEKVRALLKT